MMRITIIQPGWKETTEGTGPTAPMNEEQRRIVMQTTKRNSRKAIQTYQARAIQRQVLAISLQTNLWMTGWLVLTSLVMVIVVGPVVQQDFWSMRSLVNIQASAWIIGALGFVLFMPVSFSPYWLIGAAFAACLLIRTQIHIPLPSLQLLRFKTARLLARLLVGILAQRASVLTAWRDRLPQQTPKSKAPILLFGRTALLFAP
jgi:hypothetical protein